MIEDFVRLDSGVFVPDSFVPEKPPTAFDFFAGCGGFSLGLIQAGYKVVGALEMSTDASHTYMVNLGKYPMQIHFTSDKHQERLNSYFEKHYKNAFKENKGYRKKQYYGEVDTDGNTSTKLIEESEFVKMVDLPGSGWIGKKRQIGKRYHPVENFFFGDINEITGEKILKTLGMKKGELDLVVGGPPCQGFSTANRNAIKKKWDTRNYLVFEYARLITELMPKTFVMEEVPNFLNFRTPTGEPVLQVFGKILEDGGYMDYHKFLDFVGYTEKDIRAIHRTSINSPMQKTSKSKAQKKAFAEQTLF